MAIDLQQTRARLEANGKAIRALVSALEPEQAGWRPDADAWSILEVINHLADEEAEDFRQRLDLCLHRPETAWPAIDPQGWITDRGYAARDLSESLARFEAERDRSLAWLAGLEAPDWDRANVHPVFGAMSAGSLLRSWLAHDLLHIRQLCELQYAWTVAQSEPYDPGYAGEW
jgi:hypothetical protein